ncbi:MAG: ATP-binding protein [Actinomycetota bacterium]
MIHEHSIGTPFEIRFAPTLEEASTARQSARAFLDHRSIDAAVAGDIELIVSELASNAVEQRPDAPVRLTIALIGSGVLVTVSNESRGDIPIAEWRPSGDVVDGGTGLPDRGWGLGIVEALTDGLWCDEVDGWTSVACLRRFEPSPPSRWPA